MKTYWITDSRFKYIGLILFLIWFGFMLFFYLKADEITRDPCSICAEYMGEKVMCTTGTVNPITRTYYANGSSKTDIPQVFNEREYPKVNFSNIQLRP